MSESKSKASGFAFGLGRGELDLSLKKGASEIPSFRGFRSAFACSILCNYEISQFHVNTLIVLKADVNIFFD